MPTPLACLIVEDAPDDVQIILHELRRAGYDPRWESVETEYDFLAALQREPELIISDFSMPQFTGLRALQLLQQQQANIPFILVSGTIGEEVAVEAMRLGATDYLIKDRIARLGSAVGRALQGQRLRSERHALEQLLLLQSTALDSAADAIMITDSSGSIFWVNPAFSHTTGYSLKEAVGQTPRLLKSGKHDREFYRQFWQTIASGKPWRGEFTNRRKDGSLYYDDHTITPVRARGAGITHYVALMHDVTDRKLADEAVRLRQQLKIQHQAALLKLSSHQKTGFAQTLKEILKTDALTLGVGRVSYWSQKAGPHRIVCEALYMAHNDTWAEGTELMGAEYPRYFAALETNQLIVAEDAQGDRRTSEFTASYLQPEGIASMLDAPVWVRGNLVGVICHEHVGDRREWTLEDMDFALSISNLISLALGERERLATEGAVQQLQQRLSHVVSASPSCTYQLEIRALAYIPVWISDNIATLTGFTPPEALASNWWRENLHPEDRERCLHELTTLQDQEKLVQEYRFRRRDGSYFWTRDERRLLRDASGTPVEVVGSWSDITERKHTEEAKAALARRNEAFVRALGEIVYDHDVTSGRIEWAGDTIKCLGCTVPELGDDVQAWSERVHPDDLARAREQLATLAIENLFSCEYRIRHQRGHYLWVFDRGVMTRDPRGHITRIIGIMWDISSRKHAEESLRENEERFRQLTDNIQEVFWMSDAARQQMIYISPGYEKIWGRTAQDLYAAPQNWLAAIHEDDRERIRGAALGQPSSDDYNEVYRIQRPDGAIRWIRDRAFPVRDHSGQVYRLAGIAEDITEQRELEQQFRQAQKMEAIGQLAGGVAHDFNNLLTVIRGGGELLLAGDSLKPAKSKELLHQIIAAADRAANLTRQLLVFSRKQALQPEAIQLNQLIENLTKMLRRLIGEDIHLECQLAPGLPSVLADAGMLEQVVMNLVVNARDAMPEGGVLRIVTRLENRREFTLESESLARADTYVCLEVSDGGCGISAENLPHIFEPFFTTKVAGKGTGLGLATVFGIVQQHHGRVEVESKPNIGTTFRISLPATRSEMATGPAGSAPEPTRHLARGTETILLVEDESALRQLVRDVFVRQGYRVLEADSGLTALAIWAEHRQNIDLLLTDMVMPDGISGARLAERLGAERPGLKIVFSSGYSPEPTTKGLHLEHGKNFLPKPYNLQQLLQTVRDRLDDPAAGAAKSVTAPR